MKLLEKLLTRVTMYTLVGSVLFAIILTALALSIFQAVSFGPLALIASLFVFLGVSVGVNFGLGKLYGISSSIRSAGITALILTALFTPTLEPGVLLQYALIATIAQASKYILTYGGRHIFNPAAFGALAGGLLGLQFASWWVATPGLFIVALLGAFLVLYKTRMLAVGGLFAGISWALIILSGIIRGDEIGGILAVALASWPVIFIAGFMLSEPLTLPPRRWQKFTVAALVGVIVALPFQIGAFHTSPELALLIGNTVAFVLAFKQRKGLKLTLTGRTSLTPTVEEYTFTSPTPIPFEAGQYIELTLPHKKEDLRGVRRSFSITNKPNEKTVSLGIKFYEPSSSFKKALRVLPIGTTVQSTGITGDFVLPKDPDTKLLFIAGGIGVTPFISHILSLSPEAQKNVTILYFMRTPIEAAYKGILDASAADVRYFVAEEKQKGFNVAPFATSELIERYTPDLAERHVYISGPPVMVSATKNLLRGKAEEIKSDYFSGY